MKHSTTHFAGATALAAAFLLGGCALRSDAPNVADPIRPTTQSVNIFAPVRVHIHSLTRFVRPEEANSNPFIEAHIELLDRWGLSVRALGELRFVARFSPSATRLVTQSNSSFTGAISWSIDLSDPERNASDLYDRITRTYRIRLSDPGLQSIGDDPFTLEALFLMPGAMVLPASTQIDPGHRPR